MKRSFLLFLSVFSLFLISCVRQSYGILPFEGKDVYAECKINGKFDAIIEKTEGTRLLRTLSPSEIEGIEFVFSDSGDFVTSGNISMSFDREHLLGIYALSSLFNISEEMTVSAVSRDEMGMLTLSYEGIEYTLIFDREGNLREANILGDCFSYNVEITHIRIE